MYISVVNTLLQVTVTIFSPIRLLSMLATPLEVQLRDEKRISNPVTPATISIQHFLDHFHDPLDRSVQPIYYTPFPFSMVNHFDYYDREREENQNRVFIRLRNKTAGIWGSWLRLPDVYFGQSYRLCRITRPHRQREQLQLLLLSEPILRGTEIERAGVAPRDDVHQPHARRPHLQKLH